MLLSLFSVKSDQLPNTVEPLKLGENEEELEILRSPNVSRSSAIYSTEGFDCPGSPILKSDIAAKRIPDLTKFLATIISLLSEKKEWCTLQEKCKPENLPFEEWDWSQYKEPCKFDSKSMKTDLIAAGLYKKSSTILCNGSMILFNFHEGSMDNQSSILITFIPLILSDRH